MSETFRFGPRPSHAAYHVGRWIFPFPPLSNPLVSSSDGTVLARKSIIPQSARAKPWPRKNFKSSCVSRSGSDLFIVDNSDSDWKLHRHLKEWCELSKAINVATGYFEVGGLLTLNGAWQTVPEIRILMGDEVSKRTKRALSDGLTEIAARLDQSIDVEKAKDDFIKGVPAIVAALQTGQIKCRVYRKDKFQAKAYITRQKFKMS